MFDSGDMEGVVDLLLFEFDVLFKESIDLFVKESILSVILIEKTLHFKHLFNVVELAFSFFDDSVHEEFIDDGLRILIIKIKFD